MTNLNFSRAGNKAIEALTAAGYEAYFVGGCVRDVLLGQAPNDFDVTTSALPEETLSVFEGFRVIPTGLKHGTVTVLIDDEPIEITTFRSDGEYSDHRHPESVTFSRNLSEDLCRRDFTVNAMAYSEKTGLVDLFGGASDLKNGIIRAVGEPEKRFTEDALRILRAARFASQKGFSIEPVTADAMKKCLHLLDYVSAERIFSELKKLLMGKGVLDVMLTHPETVCRAVPALAAAVGFEQNNPHHIYDVYEHTAHAVAFSPENEAIRLAALLHDVGKPLTYSEKDGIGHFYGHTDASLKLAEDTLDALKCDNATKNTVLTLIKYHDPVIEPTEKAVRRALSKLGEPMLCALLDLKSADNLAQSPECAKRLEAYEEIRGIIAEIGAKEACLSLKTLAIGGDDLIALGVPKGKLIGKLLNAALERVVDGDLPNEKEALLEFCRKHL